MKLIRLLLLITLSIILSIQSTKAQDKIVEGTTQFLIERANDNYLWLFENKLKENKILQIYFPKTYQAITTADLKMLLTNDLLWKNCVKSDLDNLYSQMISQIFASQKFLPQNNIDELDKFITICQNVKATWGAEKYSITSMPINRKSLPKEVAELINSISDLFFNIGSSIDSLKKGFAKINAKPLKDELSKGTSLNEIKNQIGVVLSSIYEFNRVINSYKYSIEGKENLLGMNQAILEFLDNTSKVISATNILIDGGVSFSYRVMNAITVINYLIKYSEFSPSDEISSKAEFEKYLDKYKNYALFFAQLCDAKESEQVKTILKSFTVPSVSFDSKRAEDEMHFSICSYLGLAQGMESINGISEVKYLGGITTPIGLELSYGMGGSISVMFSIFDFGEAINAKLYNSDSNLQLNDLINPGVYFTYGFKGVPLAIGLGYSSGKGIRFSNTSNANHFKMFIAFDMPLFVIY